jgi:membrane protein CcdC involved in cytochrome C biogenesis
VTLSPETLGPLIGISIAAVVMFFRFGRGRSRRLRLELMWIMPTVMLLAAGSLIWRFPPQGIEWLWMVVAFAIGGAIGWQRGRMMTITVDPETHELNQSASPLAILFLLGLMVVRIGMKEGLAAEASTLHLSAAFLTDVFVVFAMGLLTVTRVEMFIRARRMLDEARSAGKLVSLRPLP